MNVATILAVIESVAVAIAAGAAVWGINAWRKEFVGKRRIELAEEVLALIYEAADNIRFMRSPAGFGGEGESRKIAEEETPEQKEARTRAFIPMERYNDNKAAFVRLYSLRYRFMAQFGQPSGEPIKKLDTIVSEIFFAARMLAQLWAQPHRYQSQIAAQRESHIKHVERYEAIFWARPSAPDEIETRLASVVSEMETRCKKIIEAGAPS